MSENFLFIIIDQIRADCLTGGLSGVAEFPNLANFARESTVFENHFTVTSPCGPARASLLSGLYAMNHRSVRNGTPMSREHTNIGLEARKAGYEPLLFGYTDTSADPRGRHPNDPALKVYENLAPGFAEIVRMRLDEKGTWFAHLKAQGYDVSGPLNLVYYPQVQEGARSARITDPAIYAAKDSDTAFLTDRFLQEMAMFSENPWFSMLTYIRPHPPFVAPAPYNTMYGRNEVASANLSAGFEDYREKHPFFDGFHAAPSNHSVYIGFDGNIGNLDQDRVQDIRSVYMGLAREVDDHIGRVVQWLKDTGQWETTTVIITGDHGEMLGDHYLWGKQAPFDPALHVPMMIRVPEKKKSHGQRVDALTESIDLAPTLLELMGVGIPLAFDGRSLLPFLDGDQPQDWRSHVFCEVELGDIEAPSRFETAWDLPPEQCNFAVLRSKTHKYVHFNGGLPPMLFDLQNDPGERHDLAGDPVSAGMLHDMAAKMLDHRMTNANRALSRMALSETGLVSR